MQGNSGAGDFQMRAYLVHHAFGIHQHIVIPETDDRVAIRLENAGTRSVVFRIMLAAIQLDHQPRLFADKIRDCAARRLLTLELGSLDLTV